MSEKSPDLGPITLIRQYIILFRTAEAEKWVPLLPGIHPGLYNTPEVQEAIALMKEKPYYGGICVAIADRQFNVIQLLKPGLSPGAFPFDPPESEKCPPTTEKTTN